MSAEQEDTVQSGEAGESSAPESNEDAETAEAPPPLPVEEQLQAALDERDASRDQFLRAQAELDNFRKRVAREREEERRLAPLPIVRDLLPIVDNLKRAADAARQSGHAPDLVEGIDLVLQQIDSLLSARGVESIASVGETFDPHRHEAVSQTPSNDHPPMTIIQEIEQGYLLHERVVRPSKVIVSSGAENAEKERQAE